MPDSVVQLHDLHQLQQRRFYACFQDKFTGRQTLKNDSSLKLEDKVSFISMGAAVRTVFKKSVSHTNLYKLFYQSYNMATKQVQCKYVYLEQR